MAGSVKVIIELGTEEDVAELYSYGLRAPYNKVPFISLPDNPRRKVSLQEWIVYWIERTLTRDGFPVTGTAASTVSVDIANGFCSLILEGPRKLQKYSERITGFLSDGRGALSTIAKIQAADAKLPQDRRKWDRRQTGQWRFFLPVGLPMVNQKSIQYFHYPPLRLLNTNKDYLDDPVPRRWEELLIANGVPPAQVTLYETVMDCAPIGAPDDEGSQGFVPVSSFGMYQKSQVKLLLNRASAKSTNTIPIVVYGAPARKRFFTNYRKAFPKTLTTWNVGDARSLELSKGVKTAVLAMNHPYAFYMTIQKHSAAGEFTPGINPDRGFYGGLKLMIESLVTARWQMKMAAAPDGVPEKVLADCKTFWGTWDPSQEKNGGYIPAAKQAQRDQTAAMVLHQGSLKAGLTGTWEFKRSLDEATALVQQFKKDRALTAKELLPKENVSTVNEMLEFLCSA